MCNEFDSVWALDTIPAPLQPDRQMMLAKRDTETWPEYRARLDRQMTPGLSCNVMTEEQHRFREMMRG